MRRLLPIVIDPMMHRCEGWTSVVARKATASYWALVELAMELDVHVDELMGVSGPRPKSNDWVPRYPSESTGEGWLPVDSAPLQVVSAKSPGDGK